MEEGTPAPPPPPPAPAPRPPATSTSTTPQGGIPPPPAPTKIVQYQNSNPATGADTRGLLLQAIRSKAPTTTITPERYNPAQTYPTNAYLCGYGNYGRLAQGDQKTSVVFLQGKCGEAGGLTFKRIIIGSAHNLAITEDGRVFTWGKCNFGQLGHGHEDLDEYFPLQVAALRDVHIIDASAGESSCLALSDTGDLYSWGTGYYGVSGHGTEQMTTTPKKLEALSGMKLSYINAGNFHSAAVTDEGVLYVWGRSTKGQLGLGDTANKKIPQKHTAFDGLKVIAAVCGDLHTLCITDDGGAWAWGDNSMGQLGRVGADSATPERVAFLKDKKIIAIAAGNVQSLFLDSEGVIYEAGYESLGITTRVHPGGLKFVKITCGETHCVAIDEKGGLYTWGAAAFGKLGHVKSPSSPQLVERPFEDLEVFDIAAGSNHTAVLARPKNK